MLELLPPRLKEYAEAYPEVRLSLWERPQGEVLTMLRAGEADLAWAWPRPTRAGLEARPWLEVRPMLMVPRGHALARRRKPVSVADLAAHPLILPPASQAPRHRKALEQMFSSRGLAIQVLLESGNVELSAALVEQGLGLAFASILRQSTPMRRPGLRFVSLEHLLPSEQLAVLWRKGRPLARLSAGLGGDAVGRGLGVARTLQVQGVKRW